jgi:branched-chain amino acid transport system substrate-binding protein
MVIRFLFAAVVALILVPISLRAEDEIKVGVMTHLTGDFAAWGQAYVQGITLAQENINNSGGVKGRRISLTVEDTRFDSALTASATKKLLKVDRVPVAMVSTFTEVMVAGPMFEQAKVPLLVFGDSGGKIQDIGKFIFSTGTWVDGYALSASEFLHSQLRIKKVAIIATNNAWAQSTADNFRKDFEQHGGMIAFRSDLNPSDSDFRTILQKIRADKIEAIFAPITSNVIPFFEQSRNLKLQIPIVAAGGALDVDVINAAPEAVEGRYVTNAFLDSERPQAKDLLARYRRKFNQDPMYPSVIGRGYDGLMAIALALKNAPGDSSEALCEALRHLDFEAAGFRLKVDATGTARLPVEVLQVRNGHLEVAKKDA